MTDPGSVGQFKPVPRSVPPAPLRHSLVPSLAARLPVVLAGVLGATGCAPPDSSPAPEPTLRLPAVATDLDPRPGVVEVDLRAGIAVAELAPGVATSVFAYRDGAQADVSGVVPGPMIEATVGDRLVVHFRNELPDLNTTVHWHGLRLPVEMDGNPMVSGSVAAGESFEYDFVLRDPGLYWYHPHVDTDVQLELGLQGLLLVHEREPLPVDRERIFALDDVALNADGSVDIELTDDDTSFGRGGPVVTVNGGPPGRIVANAGAVERWRFVNTSNGRYFRVQADGLPLHVIGWDGGFVASPYNVDTLAIAPGERYDVLVEIPDEAGDLSVHSLAFDRQMGRVDEATPLFEMTVVGPTLTESIVDPIVDVPALPIDEASTRTFTLRSDLDRPGGPTFYINDQRWPLNTPVEVALGDVDVWEVVNDGDHHHPFHIHGLFFHPLDEGLGAITRGPKDTIDIPPRSVARLAVPYEAAGMWMYHCQIPEHAERGMMGDLLVRE